MSEDDTKLWFVVIYDDEDTNVTEVVSWYDWLAIPTQQRTEHAAIVIARDELEAFTKGQRYETMETDRSKRHG